MGINKKKTIIQNKVQYRAAHPRKLGFFYQNGLQMLVFADKAVGHSE